MTLVPQLNTPRMVNREGRTVIEMNWDDADALRDHFLRHELPGTVNLDPGTHEASLELWNQPDAEKVRLALAAWAA